MTRLNNLAEAEAALAHYIPAAQALIGKNITLERMIPLMELLGNPQDQLKIVHLAGTSGKTSTAYYIAAMLQSGGHKVGLTVSPHVDTVNERLQINGQPLPEAEFCTALGEFLDLIADFTPEPTYFELLIAFVYWYFAKTGVDYAVIETGLGGLQDCTNIARQPSKVGIITDIGLDHMHVLGNTVAEIAAQKAGIIHSGNQAFMYDQGEEVTKIFQDYAQAQQAELTLFDQAKLAAEYIEPALQDMPLYQQRNWLLARAVVDYVAKRDGWTVATEAVMQSLAVQVPGRMDRQLIGSKTIVMDGAHNQQKMEAFVGSFRQLYPGRTVPILLSMKQGKEYEAVLPLLKPICSQLIITTFDVMQDLPSKSIEPSLLVEAAQADGFEAVEAISDPTEAFNRLMALPGDLAIVTGSFFLLAWIRNHVPRLQKQG